MKTIVHSTTSGKVAFDLDSMLGKGFLEDEETAPQCFSSLFAAGNGVSGKPGSSVG